MSPIARVRAGSGKMGTAGFEFQFIRLGAPGLPAILAASGLNNLAYRNKCSTLFTIMVPRLVCAICAANDSHVTV